MGVIEAQETELSAEGREKSRESASTTLRPVPPFFLTFSTGVRAYENAARGEAGSGTKTL